MIKAGIVGATGYMGGEALRVLLEHPGAEAAVANGRLISTGDVVLARR